MKKYGWKTMTHVVKASLDFIHTTASNILSDMTSRALFLERLHNTRRYDYTQSCIIDFTATFVAALKGMIYRMAIQHMCGEKKGIFMKAFQWIIEYGGQDELRGFGEFAIKGKELLSALLKTIAESKVGMPPQFMVCEILNKCLLQQSVTLASNWRDAKKDDGSLLPSIHIRMVLDAYPDMAKKTDKNGRHTLHHAVGSSSASFEAVMDVFEANPKSASVRDPVSGLYPFMLAASNGLVAATFSLLLADPNLVLGGTQCNNTYKKRKRSSFSANMLSS